MTLPYVSVVVPVFNGAHFIEANTKDITAALEELHAPFEVIVVCDGSSDGTAEAARRVADPRVRVLRCSVNAGKGNAILHGVAEARGRLVGWLDADLEAPPSLLVEAARRFEEGTVDAVIASKRHPDSVVHYPAIRRMYSWGFQLLVAVLFRINVRDTQVGAKLFRREMLDLVAPLVLVKRHAFDLEILAVGAEFGFDRIKETPVELAYGFSATSIDWRAVKWMLQDTLAIAYRIHLRHYYVRRYASHERQRMDEAASRHMTQAAE